jgi:hypothetical protein
MQELFEQDTISISSSDIISDYINTKLEIKPNTDYTSNTGKSILREKKVKESVKITDHDRIEVQDIISVSSGDYDYKNEYINSHKLKIKPNTDYTSNTGKCILENIKLQELFEQDTISISSSDIISDYINTKLKIKPNTNKTGKSIFSEKKPKEGDHDRIESKEQDTISISSNSDYDYMNFDYYSDFTYSMPNLNSNPNNYGESNEVTVQVKDIVGKNSNSKNHGKRNNEVKMIQTDHMETDNGEVRKKMKLTLSLPEANLFPLETEIEVKQELERLNSVKNKFFF